MADRQITIQNPIADPQQHRFPALLEHLRSNKIESQDDGDLDNELKILEKRVHEIKLEQRRRVPEGGVAFTRQLTEGGPPRPYADLPETVNYAPAINIKFYKHLCTDVCGVVKPTPSPNHRVILPPQEDTGVPRPFKCVICKSGFTRPAHVEDHFKKACVKRNGNPHGFHWFDDTTLLDHYAVRRGRGPSYWE